MTFVTATGAPVTSAAPSGAPAVPTEQDEPLTPELLEEEAIRGDFVLRWAVVLMAVLYGLTQINESMTLVQVKTGQYMLSHGVLPPRTDVFSYTATNRPWVNLSWLYDIVTALLYNLAGFRSLSILKAVLAGLTFGIAVHISRPRLPTWWTAVCMAAAVIACHKWMLAQPFSVTLLGLAVVFAMLERWRLSFETEEPTGSPLSSSLPPSYSSSSSMIGNSARSLWPLVLVIWLWGNLDPRMFLGLVLILCWGLGDLLQSVLNAKRESSPNSAKQIPPPEARQHFWKVALVCVAAAMVHPFLWNTLTSPVQLHGSVYPAYRAQYGLLAQGFDNPKYTVGQHMLLNSPMIPEDSDYFRRLDLAQWCGLSLVLVALVMLLVNGLRNLRHAVVWVAFLGFAIAAMQELTAAALVSAIIASLNGQAWFARQFKMDYAITVGNVLLSRGGRAVTVVTLAALAFFGGTGKLRNTLHVGSTGVGLDYSLSETIRGLQEQLKDSYDDRPLNMSGRQGDVLIWIGQKVFCDSRLWLYTGKTDETNLLTQQLQLRLKFLGRPPLKKETPKEKKVAGKSSTTKTPARTQVREIDWKSVFDTYQITHIVPHLAGDPPDYGMLGLMFDSTWQATSFGGASLIFYPKDSTDPELVAYLKSRTVDFNKMAYETSENPITIRDSWVKPPSVYERYLWERRTQIPLDIQEAQHFIQFAMGMRAQSQQVAPAAQEYLQEFAQTLSLLGIRKAQRGLAVDPNCADGYVALGIGYGILSTLEGKHLRHENPKMPSSLRYYQSVVAFNQALVAEPDNLVAHRELYHLYAGPNYLQTELNFYQRLSEGAEVDKIPAPVPQLTVRPDLVLRELKWMYDHPDDMDALSKQAVARQNDLRRRIHEFDDFVKEVKKQTAITPADSLEVRLEKTKTVAGLIGCFLTALEMIDEDKENAANSEYSSLKALLHLETGAVESASAAFDEFDMADPRRDLLARPIAISRVANAEYVVAFDTLRKAAVNQETMAAVRVLDSLAFKPARRSMTEETPWPLAAVQTAQFALEYSPEQVGQDWLDAGMLELEAGDLKAATQSFRNALAANPNATYRPLILQYLFRLTGETLPMIPPMYEIPVEFTPDPVEE